MTDIVTPDHPDFELDPIKRLSKDLKKAAATLSDDEARFLTDLYYAMQRDRIRSSNQVDALSESEEPHAVLAWVADNANVLEGNIKRALGAYSDAHLVGKWAQTITGIGPVLSAGLLAHIDITKAPTVGHIWRFAGLDPTVTWEKKSKRPWNASLKTLCWKCSESFVKTSGLESDTYGKLYIERKVFEQTRNDSGALADQAAAKLVKFKIGKDTDAYKAYSTGKLPPAHIHARAKRWAVKLFLSHYQEAAFFAHYGVLPPRPYILTREGGHAHDIQPPNMHVIPGWAEARAKAGI
jgi:hypothetical protein